MNQQYNTLKRSILPQLKKYDIAIHKLSELTENQRDFVNNYFHHTIYPVLTPMACDPGHPFPMIMNRSLYFILSLTKPKSKQTYFAFVQLPPVLPRLIRIPSDGGYHYVLVEDIIHENLAFLFKGYQIEALSLFRITRKRGL